MIEHTIFRSAVEADLPAIVAIYNQSIPSKRSTADTAPVSVQERKSWFAEHTPDHYPIFVAELNGDVVAWCSLSPYRPGRKAVRFTAEISYYVHNDFQQQGIAQALVTYACESCPRLRIKTVFAIVLERNIPSFKLLEKMGFEKWGFMPRVADFDGEECGHLYYGKRVWEG